MGPVEIVTYRPSQALVLLRPMHKRLKMPMLELNGRLMSVQFSTATNGKFSSGVDSLEMETAIAFSGG